MQKRYRIKATTYDKRGVKINTGFNSYTKTHPLQKYFSQKAGDSEHKSCVHAELVARLRARGKEIHSIVVERKENNGIPGMAKHARKPSERSGSRLLLIVNQEVIMKVMKSLAKGFTLIELMIVVAIIAIIAATVAPMIWPSEMQKAQQERAVQEIRNPIQQQCINGYAYVVTPQGIQQTLSETGTGVRCG